MEAGDVDTDTSATPVKWILLRRRAWPIIMTAATVISGMAFSLFWAPLVRHDVAKRTVNKQLINALGSRYHSLLHLRPATVHIWYWIMSSDVWVFFRQSKLIVWGYIGGIYSSHLPNPLPPGILVALAPVAAISTHYHLTSDFANFTTPRPQAWLLLGPYEMALSCVALFGLDRLAESIGIERRRRALLTVMEATAVWQTSAIWGHPEIGLVIGLVAYAIAAQLDGNHSRVGWLIGAAVCVQPVALLALPVLLALCDRRKWAGILIRGALPTLVLLAGPFYAHPRITWHVLTSQYTYPTVDHPTPWLALAPRISKTVVEGGPPRILVIIAALVIGIICYRVVRHRPAIASSIVAAYVSFAFLGWCFFEPVMVSYYVAPTIAFSLVAAGRLTTKHVLAVFAADMAATVVAFHSLPPWPWWILVTGMLGIGAYIGYGRLGVTPVVAAAKLE